MKIRKIKNSEQELMIELFKSSLHSENEDYFIDRKENFWGPYFWAKADECLAFGAFENEKLMGMISLVPLPLELCSGQYPAYLSTDFFIHPEKRGTLAAGKLIIEFHKNPPQKNMIELGLENKTHSLEAVADLGKPFGHRVHWLKPTVLYQNLILSKAQGDKMDFLISESPQDVALFWNWVKSDYYTNPYLNFAKSLDLSSLKGVKVVSFHEGSQQFSCLLVDRSIYQKIRWNGTLRVPIERYRRRLSSEGIEFRAGEELKFLNVCFPRFVNSDENFERKVKKWIHNYAFENYYFSWNIRDFEFPIDNEECFERVRFERRMCAIDNFQNRDIIDYDLFNSDRCLLESVFL